jgi:hypothetical protein
MWPKPLRRKKEPKERFPDGLHDFILNRDKVCFIYRIDKSHQCRDKWGTPHFPDDRRYLTVDHVWLTPGGKKGKRAPDRKENMVAMCHTGNVGAPSEDIRNAERSYIQDLYPGAKDP